MSERLQNENGEKFFEVDFREVCQNLYDAIHITDGEGRILFVNEAYTRTTGIRGEDIVGKYVSDLEGKLYRGSVTDEVLRTKKRVNSIATIFELDKEVLVTGIPIFDSDDKISLVVTNTRDFPELKHLERELQAMAAEQRKMNEELAYLRHKQIGDRTIVYSSEAMSAVLELVSTVAPTDVTVLITGESGTGKELVANALYSGSPRKDGPFIKVNCAAIPAELLESELFGYEAGAFTGARKSGKLGLFELANTGVILLDEIGEMPPALQAKLLRVLQQKELLRIGGSRPVKLDIRVLASTNRDLHEEVKRGRFREDLYYRLNVVPIYIMPLRERKADIAPLAEHFFSAFNKKYGKNLHLTDGAMELLAEYQWPGNVREMENVIERIVVTNSADDAISRSHVFAALNFTEKRQGGERNDVQGLKERVSAYEKELILKAIEREGSIRAAAKQLGVDHSTLVKKCRAYKEEGYFPGE